MVQLNLAVNLPDDVSQSLSYINAVNDDAEELEDTIQSIEEGGNYVVSVEWKNGELQLTIEDA